MTNIPLTDLNDDLLQVRVTLDGKDLNNTYGIRSLLVQHTIHQKSVAQLVLSGSIQMNDGNDFDPRKTVELLAGYGRGALSPIFKGSIITNTFRINADGQINCTIECSSMAKENEIVGNVVALTIEYGSSLLSFESTLDKKGIVKFAGNASVMPGNSMEINGVGDRLSGPVIAATVTHVLEAGNWTTTVGFGIEEIPLTNNAGLQLANVIKIADPENKGRIQVEIPATAGNASTAWVPMANFYASDQAGSFFIPEIGDEVLVGFLHGDPRFPVVLGSLYNSKQAPPYTAGDENNIKALVTRSRMKIEFDEARKKISLSTPAGNSIVISDDDKSIDITDVNNNSIKLSADGIAIDSSKDIKISAKGNLLISGATTAELSASGETTIKGAIVMIN
ncbi:MAG: phage baseplate assembly protein V [Bacteroidota bacterium]